MARVDLNQIGLFAPRRGWEITEEEVAGDVEYLQRMVLKRRRRVLLQLAAEAVEADIEDEDACRRHQLRREAAGERVARQVEAPQAGEVAEGRRDVTLEPPGRQQELGHRAVSVAGDPFPRAAAGGAVPPCLAEERVTWACWRELVEELEEGGLLQRSAGGGRRDEGEQEHYSKSTKAKDYRLVVFHYHHLVSARNQD